MSSSSGGSGGAPLNIIPSNDLQPEVAHIINTLRGDCVGHLLLVQIQLHPYPRFSLEKAVCNHGFFMMAPNKWDPQTRTLTRPLRLADHSSAIVLIRHSPIDAVVLQVFIDTTRDHQLLIAHPTNLATVIDQVKRMLRISAVDETVSAEFQNMHPRAGVEGFGRLFRSPTLFEDIIKSILLANCGWSRSLGLAKALCQLELKRGKNSFNNFPSPEEFIQLDVQRLKLCKLGYRADIVSSVARKVLNGSLSEFDHPHHPASQHNLSLIHELVKISGIGSFVAANVSMCIGLYATVPVDTETYRHLREVHTIKNPTERTIKDMYHKFAPYDSLGYWFEHQISYEQKFGKLSKLNPSMYHLVTSNAEGHRKRDCKQATKSTLQIKNKKKKKKGRRDNKSRNLLFTM